MRAISKRLVLAIGYLCFLGGTSLFATPVNDDPCNAIFLNLTETCTFVNYDNDLATSSTGVAAPGCGNYSGGDVWFNVSMPNNGYHIQIDLQSGSLTDMAMAVYQGTDCNNLTLVGCDDNSGNGAMPSLTIDDGCLFSEANSTFWIRVWDEGGDESGNFDICAIAKTPDVPGGVTGCGLDPVAGNTCCDAILLSDNMDGYCGNTGGYTAEPSAIPGFCAFIENNSWIAFVAAEPLVEIGIVHSNCANGIQALLYETSDCVNFNMVSTECWNAGPMVDPSGTLTATNLIPGETYYLMVDGWTGDACDYTLSIISGVETSSAAVTQSPICAGQSTTLSANIYGIGPYSYSWTPTASLDDPTSQNPVATPAVTTTYTVTMTSLTESVTKTVEVIVDQAVPTNGGINGPTSVCENTTGVLYDAISSSTTIYSWTVTGGTIVGATDGSTLTVDWATTSGTVCMTPSNECGSANEECINVNVMPAPEITATDPPSGCSPDFVNLAASGISNNTGGIGVLSFFNTFSDANSGMNPLASPLVYTPGTYWIRMDTGLNCFDVTSVQATIEDPQIVVADPQPVCFPATIDLEADVFKNETNGWPGGTYTYFIDSLAGVADVNELTDTQISSSGTYWVRYETPSGCVDVASVDVTIEEAPDLTVNAPLYICSGQSVDLTTASITDANNATVTVIRYFLTQDFANLGWAALALPSTTVSNPGTYWVRYETAAGCFDIASIEVNEIPAPTASVSGGGSVCPGEDATVTFTMTGQEPFDVVYNNSATNMDVTLTGISSPHTETVNIAANTEITIVSVTDAGSCPGTFSGTASYTTIAPGEFSISGTSTICNGESATLTFNISGTGPFDVVYNDGDDNTLSGINDGHTITVSPNANTTYTPVSVTDANACDGTVSTGATVNMASAITVQNLQETCNGTNTQYTVTFQLTGGDPSSYQVTGGGSFDFGSNTFTSNPITSGASYQFLVSDANCGPIEVNGSHACDCTTQVGSMGNATSLVCENATATLTYDNGEVLDADDVIYFVLHDSPGPGIGNVFITNTSPVFSYNAVLDFEEMYYVSAVVGNDDGTGIPDMNDPCLAISNTQNITFFEETEVAISAPSVICEGDATQLTFHFTGESTYNVEYHDSDNNTYTLSGVSDGHTVDIMPTGSITYTLDQVSNTSVPFCNGDVPVAGKFATIDISQQPTISNLTTDCDNQNINYTVSFELSGGVPSGYNVTGGSGNLMGNVFTSDPIAEGTSYAFTVGDGVCPSFEIAGDHSCDCLTSVGNMQNSALSLCDEETAVASYDGGEVLDADDVLGFILHDSPGASPLGTVFATSPTPEFNYQPAMTYGETYYISAVVGNDDGTGFPVLDQSLDPCLAISAGQPVAFFVSTEVSVEGDASLCVGESADLIFSFSTPGTFDVEYTDGTNNLTLTDISNGYTLEVTPMQTTTYELISVNNHDEPFCPGAIASSANEVTIDVSEGPIVFNMVFTCDDESINYVLTFDISGGNTANYSVVGLNGTLSGTSFTSDPMLGGTNFAFEVNDGGPCPTQESGQYACLCLPDMMPILTVEEGIGCGGESDGVVSVTNFSGTAPFTYQWSDGSTGEEADDLSVGWHYVTMTDTYGCTAVDSVFLDEPTPITASLSSVDPLCFDGIDGSISVENLFGGTGEYDVYLNVLASYNNQVFTGLKAGKYVVTIEDDKGCTWMDSILITNPDELMVNTSEDLTIQLGDSIELEVMANLPLDTIIWSPQLPSRCVGCVSQYVHPQQETRFKLAVVSEHGCEAEAAFSVFVTKENPIYIPNAFSPNGDGINDVLTVYPGISVSQIKTFNIYTRWGALLYKEENFLPGVNNLGWDGYFRGNAMASGVYVYFAEIEFVDGTTEIVRGDVTLIR